MVQRCDNDYGSMVEDDTGFWVTHDDYEALELKLLAAHSHIERALASSPNKKDGYIKMALRELE